MCSDKCYAVVPAAGIGRRMGSDIPKQYLRLGDKTVIEHTLARLCSVADLEKIVVVIAQNDDIWPTLMISRNEKIITAPGGEERCHSVLNGLQTLNEIISDDSWVLVHDAARPCVRISDITQMLSKLNGHEIGGILGSPVRDTLKRSLPDSTIEQTVDRNALWQAFTPQMFRMGLLRAALQDAISNKFIVTDEAQAVERRGHQPVLIEGYIDNIKITRPEDLALAELYLAHQATS